MLHSVFGFSWIGIRPVSLFQPVFFSGDCEDCAVRWTGDCGKYADTSRGALARTGECAHYVDVSDVGDGGA